MFHTGGGCFHVHHLEALGLAFGDAAQLRPLSHLHQLALDLLALPRPLPPQVRVLCHLPGTLPRSGFGGLEPILPYLFVLGDDFEDVSALGESLLQSS